MKRAFSIKKTLLLCLIISAFALKGQVVERVFSPTIGTPQLYPVGDQTAMPVISLGGDERLSLEFDDLEGGVKNYYYTYILCDYNWQPVRMTPFEYIKGFAQNRITTYRTSTIALTNYTHYQALLPERNAIPSVSGNYLLKVFINGDTSQTVFTRQFVVTEKATSLAAEVVQPFAAGDFASSQRLRFTANVLNLNAFSIAQQVRAVVLQNKRWDNAVRNVAPTFVRGKEMEFNLEGQMVFRAGTEWRWLDLRSFRLQSDRVDHAIYGKSNTELFLVPDGDRRGQRYIYFPDYNGSYRIITYETINPFWQGDYGLTHFYLRPPQDYDPTNDKIFLAGGFTDFVYSDRWQMKPQGDSLLTNVAFLKQGYYNYTYFLQKAGSNELRPLESNYWETENGYDVLLYYKGFADRNDRIIGHLHINSRRDRPGLSF